MKRNGTWPKQSGYPTPEQAALASYSPSAGAFVVRVTRNGRVAEVEIGTDASRPHVISCINGRYALWYARGEHG